MSRLIEGVKYPENLLKYGTCGFIWCGTRENAHD